MKNVLILIVLVSISFIFSDRAIAYNEFDLYLDYIHSGRTEIGNESTDYNLIALGINYLSDENFLTAAEFGISSSAAFNLGPETKQKYINLKFGFRLIQNEKLKMDPVVSVFSLTDKNNLATIDVTGTLIGPELEYLLTNKFSIDFNYYFSLAGSVKLNKEDLGDDGKLGKYELKFKYAFLDNGFFVLSLRNISYSGGDLERTSSGFALGYHQKY